MAGEQVTFPSANTQGDGHAVLFSGGPDATPNGLIVVHEWWGMNEQIQVKGEELASDSGFVVLVPDMYRGKITTDHEEAGHLMHDLDWPGAVCDIQGAAQFLLSRGCKKVGITGFCMGGALSFLSAALVPEISAAAPFYGIPSPELGDLTKIAIPVQAHFGMKDEIQGFSTPTEYNPLRQKLVAAGVPLEFHEYNAGHAFTNRNAPGYDATIAKLSFGLMFDFMDKVFEDRI